MSTGAPLENGISIRYPSTAILCVDSADGEKYNTQGFRLGTNNPADIYLNKQQTLMFGYMTRVALTEVNFQWDVPNVNTSNNTLTISEFDSLGNLVANRRIIVDGGWAGLPELCNAIYDALTWAGSPTPLPDNVTIINGPFLGDYTIDIDGYTIGVDTAAASSTVSIVNPVVTIKRTDGGRFLIQPFNKLITPLPGEAALPVQIDDLTNMLGLTPTKPLYGPESYKSVTGSYASTQYTPYVDVVSNLLTKNQNVSDNSSAKRSTASKLARIYLSNEEIAQRVITITYDEEGFVSASTDNGIGTSPFVFRREFKVPKQIQWNKTENIDVIDLQVLDYRGNVLPIDPGASWAPEDTPGQEANLLIANTADFQFTVQVTEV